MAAQFLTICGDVSTRLATLNLRSLGKSLACRLTAPAAT